MMLLSPLDEHTVLDVTREGGLAFIPAFNVHQRVAWCDLPLTQRERLCALINPMASQAAADSGPSAGRGDQRFYRILILGQDPARHLPPEFEIVVPESSAPPELAMLWKKGRLE
ncbi:protealysin inhibitor emfourin [Acerihabitans sp. TG2]|uniref:protealysin inhibitor emfourin n=1 Tax=Acerihabitans sp. TG2 TaxID=3096008 RepID=UPI002B2329BD|nr:protealysin inhibitor emfourin [Acerihabitans sp. TG2]MEA9392475.1 protealysin inhibitor emfourin [Acerihabitans sp. TG2]